MALVVLLRGVNVGGHRTVRPSALAAPLVHLGAVNMGGAGTLGLYRRQMKVISCLGMLDRLFGVTVMTRNWNTLGAIASVVHDNPPIK